LNEPLASIIISNYNGREHLLEFFESLEKISYKNFEIIFIDNNSSDDSVDFIKKNYNYVKIIQNKKDYGFSGANNIAARYATGKYLIFLNIDTVVDRNWLIELIKVAETSEDIGIVVGKELYYHERTIINFAGFSSDKYLKHHRIGYNERDCEMYNKNRITFFASGASFLIKREVYQKIGLFEDLYYAFYEDLDLSWRTWLAGYKIIYAPKSFIYHKTGAILGRKNPRKTYLIERNKLRTLLKNYELKTIIKILPIYFVKRFLVTLRDTINLNKDSIIKLQSYIKAIIWNMVNIRSLIKKRKFINSIRKRNDNFIFVLNRKIELILMKDKLEYQKN